MDEAADSHETVRPQGQLQRLSKFLALLLRHRPAKFPLKLDEQGYASLDEVMAILHGLPNFRWANRADVAAVVNTAGRRRYEIVGDRIRALYGHSALRPTYEPVVPPAVLYHGTAPEAAVLIRREGLHPMDRGYVHLSATPELARSTGLRHTASPVILRIRAAEAHAAGIPFYHPIPEIYLSEAIPPEFIETPGEV